MLPAIALVGRPNVGKSTLFNRLTRARNALVADEPGVTRDRRYGVARVAGQEFIVVDTGGLGTDPSDSLNALVERQVERALDEVDAVVFVVDYQDGLTAEDERIMAGLRRLGKPLTVAVNKAEGVGTATANADFYSLGVSQLFRIAALHGHGISELVTEVLGPFGDAGLEGNDSTSAMTEAESGPKVAVIGRPNVGKSTLINRLLGTERLVTSAEAGTTRDSILVPCERDGRRFVLIDTAGIRRRARVDLALEKYSIVQSLKAIEEAGAVIVLLDASEGVTEQDLHLIGLVVDSGRSLVIGLNKWDGLDPGQRRRVTSEVSRRLDFVGYAEVLEVAALHGSGIAELVRSALTAYDAGGIDVPTPRLNEILRSALARHEPPIVRGRRIRLRYAHQGGRHPPIIVIHGSQAGRVPRAYQRYLENTFREVLGLTGTPIRLELRSGDNPYAGKRNEPTKRQREHRQRVIRHSRSRR